MTGFLVHADYKPKMDKRREDRINVALDRCKAWRPGGRVIIDGQEATIARASIGSQVAARSCQETTNTTSSPSKNERVKQ